MVIHGIQIKKGWAQKVKVNKWNGYRSKLSKKNQETWEFAHEYWGKLLVPFGFILLFLTIGAAILVVRGTFAFIDTDPWVVGLVTGAVGMVVQLIVFMILMIPTDNALRKEFDENGERRR
jgi:heme/copper-type cytochrome/quinol oxidase subunit 4